MTTLSHSPSPAASPRASFHIAHSRQRQSHLAGGASPRRPFNAPSPSPTPQQARREQRLADSGAQAAVVGQRQVPVAHFVHYTDHGTQYSPEGFPPTASAHHAVKVAPAPELGRRGDDVERDQGRKRKEHPMSDAATTAGGVSSSRPTYTPHGSAPSEPQPRTDPGAGGQPGPSTVSDLTRREAGHIADYPQEARSTLSASSSGSKRARPNEIGEVTSMPRAYETCNPKDLGILISNMLMELIRLNDQIPLRDGRLTRFHSRAPPGISVSDYLQRLIQHATLSPPILLSMVYYIDRLCAMYNAFTINSLTVHRFLITAACVAAKGLSDSFWTNPTYARIGGIPVTELATLELELLQRVQWRIVPKPEVLVNYYEGLIDRTDGWELERSESDSSSLPDESGTEDDLNGADEPA